MFHFYTILKHKKTRYFLLFLGGIEMGNWFEKGKIKILKQMKIISEIYSTNA